MSELGERQSVRVTIGGEEYVLRANVEADYTLRCARLVDERLREIRARFGALESHKAAILAALSLADDLFRLQEELKGEREAALGRLADLTASLERVLDSPRGPFPPAATVGRPPTTEREDDAEAGNPLLPPRGADPQTSLL